MARPDWRRLGCVYRYRSVWFLSLALLMLWYSTSFRPLILHSDRSSCNGPGPRPSLERVTGNRPRKVNVTRHTNPDVSFPPPTVQLERTFSYHEDIVSPLRIPYHVLAGKRPQSRKYMSIGISSIRRKTENYLLGTLQSIFTQSSASELEDMVVVIYLANWDPVVNKEIEQEVSAKFGQHLEVGHLLLVTSPRSAYPILEGLKRNYGDSEDRVKYRSKQNVDYAFLCNFCSDLAQYHLVLEDDVQCSRNFLTMIRKKVAALAKPWVTIAFSKLGYIGKLYHSVDLPALSRFLLMFYDEMPCDWLLDHFFRSKAQSLPIRISPSLFQHVGVFSSFQGGHNTLKDDEFVEVSGVVGDNPPAVVFTDLGAYERNTLDNVYEGRGFFWGMGVTNRSHISVHFKDPVVLQRVRIVTGSPEHRGDILKNGLAEVGWRGVPETDVDVCQMFVKIGDFKDGILEVEGMDLRFKRAVDCLRIRATATQTEWLLLQELSVWAGEGGNTTSLSSNVQQTGRSVE